MWERSNMEEFWVCLNLENLSQGGDCWKVSQIVFLSQLKVIDSFLIEDILVKCYFEFVRCYFFKLTPFLAYAESILWEIEWSYPPTWDSYF